MQPTNCTIAPGHLCGVCLVGLVRHIIRQASPCIIGNDLAYGMIHKTLSNHCQRLLECCVRPPLDVLRKVSECLAMLADVCLT